jgi:cytochrome c556
MRTARLAIIGALGLALLAGPSVASESAKNAVEYRAAVMKSLANHAGAIAKVVKGEVPYGAHVGNHAEAIAATAPLVRDIFPEGTGPDAFDDTRALPAIWDKPGAFDEAVEDFVAAAEEFGEAGQSDDRQTVLAAFKQLGDTCGACHDDFRKEKDQ